MTIREQLDKNNCVGCGACMAACSVGALKLKPDEYGYYVYNIDEEKCINCGKCIRVCPQIEKMENKNTEKPDCFAFVAGDEEILMKSSSGGFFTYLALDTLNKGGIVCGAGWNDDFYVVHQIIDDRGDLDKLRKSKYMQSYIGDIFVKLKGILNLNRVVLFSGCPCQVAGLKKYLAKDYKNLILVDLLCGNSPSSMFFHKYLNEDFPEGVQDYRFRDKIYGWRWDCVSVVPKNTDERIIRKGAQDGYQSVYHDHTMCAPHCEHCNFHLFPREGDISIGDFWGIQNKDSSIPAENGVSVVLCNNEKSRDVIKGLDLSQVKCFKNVPLDWIGGNGYMFLGSSNFASSDRDFFYENILTNSFSDTVLTVKKFQDKRLINKYKSNYELLVRWMYKKNRGENIASLFVNSGYRKIAIYGMADIGMLLFQELKKSDVEVKYCIDRNVGIRNISIPIFGKNDILPNCVDAIIVTVIWDFDNISNDLKRKINCQIISIADVI